MPFPLVLGLPNDTPKSVLQELRQAIVKGLLDHMQAPARWTHPIFVLDPLSPASEPEDGSATVCVILETGMFHNLPDSPEKDHVVQSVTKALGQIIFDTIGGWLEVEVFVGDLNPAWRALIKPPDQSE